MQWVNAIIAGIFSGSAYALIGISVTLMYRSTGTLSLAHAAFAMVAAFVYSDLTIDKSYGVFAAAGIALLVTIVFGLLVERLVMRPVRNASPTARLIVTVGVLGATSAAILLIYGSLPSRAPRLYDGGVNVGDEIFLGYQELTIFAAAAGGGVGLAIFLKRTRLGRAIRANADNADVARLMGIPARRISQLNWFIAALSSGVAGILIAPSTVVSVGTFPLFELRALAAVLFAGLGSLVLTFAGGLGLGIIESLTVQVTSAIGAQETVTLLAVVAILVLRKTWYTVDTDTSLSLSQSSGGPAWVLRIRDSQARRQLRPVAQILVIALVAVTVLHAIQRPSESEYWAFVWAVAMFYMLQGVSLVLLSGWGGQVTLMQAAYAGIGAYGTLYLVNERGWPTEYAMLGAILFATVAGAVAGLPALRVTGPQFAIVSLAFGAWASTFLFTRPELQGTLPRDTLFGLDITQERKLYVLIAAATALVFLAAWNVRRSVFGTFLLIARDEPLLIAQFGGYASRIKMAAFVMASAVAGLGGAIYGILLTGFRPTDFAVNLSINLLLFTVVGGITSLAGAVIAGPLFIVLPAVIQGTADTGNGAQRTQ
ncbi:ABC transporter permease, partial [Sporichthya polymorpha]|uniref:ABC transporter permease n=1 Tax=Sporichthya polymorpha TaxID=35751 RepID=UPI000371038F